jgi:hypothetical protein
MLAAVPNPINDHVPLSIGHLPGQHKNPAPASTTILTYALQDGAVKNAVLAGAGLNGVRVQPLDGCRHSDSDCPGLAHCIAGGLPVVKSAGSTEFKPPSWQAETWWHVR